MKDIQEKYNQDSIVYVRFIKSSDGHMLIARYNVFSY